MPYPFFLHRLHRDRVPRARAARRGSPGRDEPSHGAVYERWRKEALLAEASERSIEGCERMSKGELIAALNALTRPRGRHAAR
jgi:hypothetical protein